MRPFYMQTNVLPALPLIARCSQQENVKQASLLMCFVKEVLHPKGNVCPINHQHSGRCGKSICIFVNIKYVYDDTDESLCSVFVTIEDFYMKKYESHEEMRGQGTMFIEINGTLQQNSLKCRRILQGLQTFGTQTGNMLPSECVPIHSCVTTTPSLFNSWQSLFTHQPWWQIRHHTNINMAFSVLSDFFINVWARSTEEFSLSLILFQIHFSIWKKSTSVKKNMKRRLSSQEIDSFGCLLKLEPIFMFCSVAQQQVVWHPNSG